MIDEKKEPTKKATRPGSKWAHGKREHKTPHTTPGWHAGARLRGTKR